MFGGVWFYFPLTLCFPFNSFLFAGILRYYILYTLCIYINRFSRRTDYIYIIECLTTTINYSHIHMYIHIQFLLHMLPWCLQSTMTSGSWGRQRVIVFSFGIYDLVEKKSGYFLLKCQYPVRWQELIPHLSELLRRRSICMCVSCVTRYREWCEQCSDKRTQSCLSDLLLSDAIMRMFSQTQNAHRLFPDACFRAFTRMELNQIMINQA